MYREVLHIPELFIPNTMNAPLLGAYSLSQFVSEPNPADFPNLSVSAMEFSDYDDCSALRRLYGNVLEG